MNYRIRSFFVVIAGFMVLITLFSLLMPSTVIVHRTALVNSGDSALSKLQHLSRWPEWYPAHRESMQTGSDANGKAYLQFERNNKMYRFEAEESFPHGIRVNFYRENERPVSNIISVLQLEDGTQLEWKAIHKLPWYPWEKFAGIFLNEMAGPVYQQALDSLAASVESH